MLESLRSMFFDPSELEVFSQDESPLVIMGRGHSGTRVLTWACSLLGMDLGAREENPTADPVDRPFTKEIKRLALKNLEVTSARDTNQHDYVRFLRAVYRFYGKLDIPESGMWGWKFPETYSLGPYVARAFPKAKYIHLVRDGRDIAFKYHQTDNLQKPLGRAIAAQTNTTNSPHHLLAAASWAYQVQQFNAFKQELPASSVFELHFEELCSKPIDSMQKVCEFLDIPMTAECERYLLTSINPRKVSQYSEEDAQTVLEIEKLIGPVLEQCGYDVAESKKLASIS